MRLDRFITLQIASPLLGKKRSIARLPVLMYHSVCGEMEEGIQPYYSVTTTPARFEEQMRWLREAGFTSMSLEHALKLRSNETQPAQNLVAITFDEGFRDFYT